MFKDQDKDISSKDKDKDITGLWFLGPPGVLHYHVKVTIKQKNPTLDKDQLSNYRPISNLSLISKIIERVVKSRLTDYF